MKCKTCSRGAQPGKPFCKVCYDYILATMKKGSSKRKGSPKRKAPPKRKASRDSKSTYREVYPKGWHWQYDQARGR